MLLFWTPESVSDREDIYAHIEADNPAAAVALDAQFSEKAHQLLDHPDLLYNMSCSSRLHRRRQGVELLHGPVK
jgi:plasmid stabilization system protein ParE